MMVASVGRIKDQSGESFGSADAIGPVDTPSLAEASDHAGAFDPDDPLFQEYSYPSMFGLAEVFTLEDDEGTSLRVLLVDGGFQSATYLYDRRFEAPFAYCQEFERVFALRPQAARGLLVGGGALSYPKHALARHDNLRMDVVEIDPVVIDIARRHFFVDELEAAVGERLRVFTADGVGFLRRQVAGGQAVAEGAAVAMGLTSGGLYDFVINDSFGGTVQDAPLLSPESLKLSKQVLVPGGVYMANVVAEDDEGNQDEATLAEVQAALGTVFAHVVDAPCVDDAFSGSVNHVFFASDGPL